jgi:hypothetical protein
MLLSVGASEPSNMPRLLPIHRLDLRATWPHPAADLSRMPIEAAPQVSLEPAR